jgi:hypothetical protein
MGIRRRHHGPEAGRSHHLTGHQRPIRQAKIAITAQGHPHRVCFEYPDKPDARHGSVYLPVLRANAAATDFRLASVTVPTGAIAMANRRAGTAASSLSEPAMQIAASPR